MEGDQYELVGTRDWQKTTNAGGVANVENGNNRGTNGNHDNNGNMSPAIDNHEYSLPSLDADWFPVLRAKLRGGKGQFDEDSALMTAQGTDEADYAFLRSRSRGDAMDDIDGRGTFDGRELEQELRSMHRSELEDQLGISMHKVRDIIRRSDVHRNGQIEYKVFLETVQQYRLSTEQASTLASLARAFAYAEEFSCRPPTLFMLFITLVETGFFVYMCVHLSGVHGMDVTWEGPVPFCSVLIYNPYRRYEAWRFITYMLVHIGIGHFVFNMIMQILVGVFLEMEQEGWVGSLRVAAVYLTGVAAGSLGTSLSDPDTYVAGASGGVYSLIAAHLATLALNWQEDSAVKIKKVIHRPLTRTVRLIFIGLLTAHDVAFAVYVRFYSDGSDRTGFMGHLCGALAGLLVGIFVLDNRRVRSWEPVVQWLSLSLFGLLVTFAVVWNIFADSWTDGGFYPEQDHSDQSDSSGNCQHYDYY